jgi:phage FluMu protein Com
MAVVHGTMYKDLSKTKCNKLLFKLPWREKFKVVGTVEIHKITCPDCKQAHQLGKI